MYLIVESLPEVAARSAGLRTDYHKRKVSCHLKLGENITEKSHVPWTNVLRVYSYNFIKYCAVSVVTFGIY